MGKLYLLDNFKLLFMCSLFFCLSVKNCLNIRKTVRNAPYCFPYIYWPFLGHVFLSILPYFCLIWCYLLPNLFLWIHFTIIYAINFKGVWADTIIISYTTYLTYKKQTFTKYKAFHDESDRGKLVVAYHSVCLQSILCGFDST